jgi:lipopolysaccharide exporter
LLIREFKQGRILLANAISFLPMNALLIVLAAGEGGAMAFAWSRVVGQLISGVVMAASVNRRYWPRIDKSEVIPVLRFGFPLAGANLLTYALLNADYAIIGRSSGPSELGIYMLAFSVASWSTSVLSSTINSVAMPAFSALVENPVQLKLMLSRFARIVAIVAFPIGALTVALALQLVQVLYGEVWLAAAPVLAVLAVYGSIFSVSLLLSNLLVGTGRAHVVLIVQAVSIAVLIPTIIWGISSFGIIGAAYAHVVVIFLTVMPMYLWALRSSVASIARVILVSTRAPLAAAIAAGLLAAWAASTIGDHFGSLMAGCLAGGAAYGVMVLPLIRGLLTFKSFDRTGRLIKRFDSMSATVRSKLGLGSSQNDR